MVGRSSRRSKGSKWNLLCSFVDASMCERIRDARF